MTDHVETFFAAWGEPDAETRAKILGDCLSPDIEYTDPRLDAPLTGVEALAGYVAMYTQYAPGATARVVASTREGDCVQATVEFAMADGMIQNGHYKIDVDDQGRATRMVGKVGTGEDGGN